ncbi:Hypothetical Protein FCC1311_099952 [Hondaea fermentalgiana]|uniref:Uncharacterized protein n=1 Tax=Hondaea fermentalgiana TaxID=2315210 RepID=A0A2R5GSC3_9STRA|nr:Hypothetical Protein FCC1311_099952 [Hondaea fermentalgiana]|eukprot:GBG33772.1 Hypothetical Protein FCC1311_099952 [Hondaea fermentalgiana]
MSATGEMHQRGFASEKRTELQEKASKFAKKQLRQTPSRINDASVGLMCAAQGVWGAVHVPKVRNAAWTLVKVMLKKMIYMYSMLLAPAMFFWPVTVPFTFAFPSVVYSLLTMIPMWAFNAAQSESRAEMNGLFMAELTRINSDFAKKVQSAYDSKSSIKVPSMYQQFRKGAHFMQWSAIYNSVAVVPIFSPIAVALQTSLTAEKLGWSLMQPFLRDYKRLSYEDQRDLMNERWWTVVGFAAPFVLLGFVPFVSAFTLPLAQAGAAHLALRFDNLPDADNEDKHHGAPAESNPAESSSSTPSKMD